MYGRLIKVFHMTSVLIEELAPAAYELLKKFYLFYFFGEFEMDLANQVLYSYETGCKAKCGASHA